MSNYVTNFSAAELLQRLGDKELVVDQELSNFVISQQQEQELPLYLRALVGVGAFIASLCFIGFLFASELIDLKDETKLIVWGLVFVAGAIGLLKIAGREAGIKNDFFVQTSFAAMAVGKTLFVFGVGEMYNSGWYASLALLIITGITYAIYRMSIDRFLSSFAVLFSILANILWDRDVAGYRELLLNGFFLFLFAGAAILLTYGKIKRDHIPLSHGFVFALCACVLFLAAQGEFGAWGHKELINLIFINIVLTGGLIALFGWAAGGVEKLKTEPLILACLGAALLGLISAPGILLSIGLMVLGYAKHDKLHVILGALLISVFIWLYYYNLDTSLLVKSGVLIGSGVLALAGRYYLQYKGWDRPGTEGDEPCVGK